MNIWIINHYATPPSFGGLNRHYYFARELISKGHKVRIITASTIHNSDVNFSTKGEKFCQREVDGLVYTFLNCPPYTGNGFSRIKNMLSFSLNIKKARKAFKDDIPDVIYTSSPHIFTAFFAERLARKMKKPCVVEIRDLWPLSIVEYGAKSRNNLLIKMLFGLEKNIYKKADALVFTVFGGKDYITDQNWQNKVKLDKIFNINNGVDLSKIDAEIQNFPLCDTDLESEKFKVIYCGSIRRVNKIGLLIESAKVIEEKDKDIVFLIYGEGNEKEGLIKRCHDEGINNVAFKGMVPKKNIPYVLSKSEVNVINVQQTNVMKYGCSFNKLFDYLASGKPIVSNIKVNHDIITDKNCGVVTDDQTPEKFAEAILKIKNLSKEEYAAMSKNAFDASQEYDYARLAEKFFDVCQFAIDSFKK